ncbi:DUF3857 domain-containing transglutaminase family protein [Flavobacterium jejuense]|uniref:DUF3857 domain-containing transglutaminase family protein n=1 Tax=Flavobacterium jejuense TaxID=1544455 RepID=A0ABX0IV20_9FLAO|nr:DUF3857 domain-containing transglutaminase family protein [Flavobacterium jejuense]NHN27662.1 DUF3857 domain-containing transglutaminase family protein [Flavobacterium jejuense]
MRIKILFLLLITFNVFSQKDLSSLLISGELKEKANSVVRFQKIEVVVQSQKLYSITTKKTITVLNENGLKNIDAREYYSKSEKINSIEAIIYDSFGKEIKKIRKKDFKDQSVADGFSILSDNRVLYLDYTPTQYPFTVVFESEKESINTAFLPSWYAVDDYYESIEKSEFTISYPSDLGFKYKELNFEGFDVKKSEEKNTLSFVVENLPAEKPEDYSPSFKKIVPNVMFGLEKFSLEGVDGTGKSWEEFGKVYYDELINNDTDLSQETIKKISELTKNAENPIEKAKIIYKYVQDKTRYVSIQLGIGGWKPMLAKDVDRLGYGDCKALSNYTRVLLDNVGVKSYYTVIYGDSNKKDLDKDFVSYQGNHAILTLPYNDKNYFLECTSQTNPFAFGGDFTDDRYALMIKPEGGFIVKTNGFKITDSYQKTIGDYSVDEEGNLSAKAQIKSGGIQYDNRAFLSRINDEKELLKSYKNKFSWISNLKIENLVIKEDRDKIELLEDFSFTATDYSNKAGNSIYFPINVFNKNEHIPDKYRNRKNNFEIKRGYQDIDEITVSLPRNCEIEFLPEKIELETKFGSYKMTIQKLDNGKLLYSRMLTIKSGDFSKEEYEEYRKFREQIAKNDNLKIVLTIKKI